MIIAVLDDYEGVFARSSEFNRLKEKHEVTVYSDKAQTENELFRRLENVEIVVLIRERTSLPGKILERLSRLYFIVQTGTGVAHIDLETAKRLGISWKNMPDISSSSVSELTFAMILSGLRRLPELVRSMRLGEWQPLPGRELKGKTLGIVGFGSIGKEVARIAKAFQARVIVWSPSLDPEKANKFAVEYAALDEVLKNSDIVSLHLRAVPEFKNLLSRERLMRMKRGAILINTSRSMLLDMDAAVDLLQSGHLACGAFDVYDTEPLPADAAVRRLDNVTITPHIGWITFDLLAQFASRAAEYIERFSESNR